MWKMKSEAKPILIADDHTLFREGFHSLVHQWDDFCVAEPEPEGDRFPVLTVREIQILQLLVDGLTNTEMGGKLFLSDQTIKKYLSRMMQKLDLKNRVQMTAYAFRNGLVE
jgi:DNA-binding CsgD family transcriptional regulator